jgi:hypothetical protein
MNADERFRTTDERYWPAAGTMRPRPTVFVVTEPMELAQQLDLCVLLSDFHVLAAGPDFMVFDLSRKATQSGMIATNLTSPTESFYSFPAEWRRIEWGIRRRDVLDVLGQPHRIVIRDDLRKPVETWFYGPADSYAIVLIDDRVFAVASTRIAS